MKKLNIALPFILLVIPAYLFSKDIDITELGAVPDSITLNTNAIQTAINMVAESGGGTVIVPPGKFLTGSLVLKNGVTLYLRKGAYLLGSENLADYLSIKPSYVALRTGNSTKQLIFAENQLNIAIMGEGTILGRGGVFKKAEKNDEPGITRPHLIQIINCKNIRIEGVSMKNSGGWMQHYLACENLVIKDINVFNHCNLNNDGIDIDGCQDVVVSGCIVDSDDDGICLKSTSPKPCKNVVVSNCVVKSHCNALKLGTESTGGFQNIVFNGCVVSPSADPDPIYGTPSGQSAISIEMVDGGVLENVSFSNITVNETDCPIFIRLGNRARKYTPSAPEPGVGILRNVNISDVIAITSSATTSNITGFPGGYAENISINNVMIINKSEPKLNLEGKSVVENDKAYPTAAMFGKELPASAFFVRHVKNISFNNVQVFIEGKNAYPFFVLHDVIRACISKSVVLKKADKNKLLTKDNLCEDIKVHY